MFKSNNSYTAIFLCVLFVFLSGCSSSARLTELVNLPNEKWRISSLVVSKDDKTWSVSGRLNSQNIFDLPDGYILVSIQSENGILIEQQKTQYRRVKGIVHRHSRHQFGVALFSVNFKSIPEKAKVIAEHFITTTDSAL